MFDLIRDILEREHQDRVKAEKEKVDDLSGWGEKDGRCNRTACGSRHEVVWYNRGSRAYYCEYCATEINRHNFGGQTLCVDVRTLKSTYEVGQRVRILARDGLPERVGTVLEDSPHIPLLVVRPDSDGTGYISPGGYAYRYEHIAPVE